MVAEPWIVKMGNQVSRNLKHALLLESKKTTHQRKLENNINNKEKQVIGILSFEVANVMSKTVHLHKSLTDSEILKLMSEISKSEGLRNLVSNDESYLLEIALAEKLDDLNRVAGVVSRLGKKCLELALQGFEHVYGDLVTGVIDVKELGFLVKDMEGMVKRMERYANATANLYSELEVLNELELATKKFQQNQHEETKRAYEQKLIWQKQDVGHLKDISVWNQTYDKAVELLARTVCTIYARISVVFGEYLLRRRRESLGDVVGNGGVCSASSPPVKDESREASGHVDFGHNRLHMVSGPLKRAVSRKSSDGYQSGPLEKRGTITRARTGFQKGEAAAIFRADDIIFPCATSPGRLIMDCISFSSSASKLDDDDADDDDEDRRTQISRSFSAGIADSKREHPSHLGYPIWSRSGGVSFSGDPRQARSCIMNGARFGPKSRLSVFAPPSTVGGSALALHYANVIIVIEKLLRYPHLVGEEARDDLYHMLPTSLRMSLRTNLKSYVKNLAIYDAPLAHDWKENLDRILRWLAPLAHNTIRWQSERNFEQHQTVKRTNVLLLQTLYFTDRGKTEAALCELLVGLNYICRFEQQQNALLDCASSFDFEDCMQWQLQCRTGGYVD